MKMLLGVEKEAELANAIGMKPSAFSNRKKSGSIPYSHYLEKAKALNVNLNWLFYDSGPMYKDDNSDTSEGTNLIYLDPAVQILSEALEETGVVLNEKQKQACLEILREELDKSDTKTKQDIKKYLRAFGS